MNSFVKSLIAGTSIAGMFALSGVSFTMAQTNSLSGTWRLANMTVENSPMPMLPLQEKAPIADFSDGRVSGSGGCNQFTGSYETKEGTLTVSPLASTFKACEESLMTQEQRFLTAMQDAKRYEVDQGQLTVFYENDQGSGVLRFVSQNNEPVRALW